MLRSRWISPASAPRESVGPRQISGSGGQGGHRRRRTEWRRGASRLLPCAPPTLRKTRTRGSGVSSPVVLPVLPEGAVVTLTRSNTHFVATEYGAVCLRGLTVPQRAKALSPSPTRTFGIGWRRSFTASTACDGPSVCGNREWPRNRRVPGPLRLSVNLPGEGFGGKDSVKENRQGCLSRPIKRLLSTFLKCSKVQQLVEKTFLTS